MSVATNANMTIDDVKEILLKYKKDEQKIDGLLQKRFNISSASEASQAKESFCDSQISTEQVAFERNKKLLQGLKFIKSNLRSKAIYSPVEMRWEEICRHYLENPSLSVTSWKCRVPVFV